MVKRPASSSSTRSSLNTLERENAKLKKENARLRGETNEKAPVAPNKSEAYITGVCGGAKYMISFDSEGFGQNPTSTLITCLSESIRDGRAFELALKGGKKIDPKKTFSTNGILPNSFVYVRYTGPPLDDWVWMSAMLPKSAKLQHMTEKGSRQWEWSFPAGEEQCGGIILDTMH